nr:MAG TPA: hypothetical protein [Caudoviricetes sp.]
MVSFLLFHDFVTTIGRSRLYPSNISSLSVYSLLL